MCVVLITGMTYECGVDNTFNRISLCVSVMLSTVERLYLESSSLVCKYIFRIFRSKLLYQGHWVKINFTDQNAFTVCLPSIERQSCLNSESELHEFINCLLPCYRTWAMCWIHNVMCDSSYVQCEVASVGRHWTFLTSSRCIQYRAAIWIVWARISLSDMSLLMMMLFSMCTQCCSQLILMLAGSNCSLPTFASPKPYVSYLDNQFGYYKYYTNSFATYTVTYRMLQYSHS